jgi:hypothetical protein
MCEEESVEYLRDLVHRKEAADTTGGEAGGLVSRLIGQGAAQKGPTESD